ncbi:MAG TPA: NAD-dependent succinate-semialdehyde dehydrogenase [Planctomycetaceae bacterium]|nr:NAD-dependent succinate-semialdehyde dehydrogenase [Planctomycetaceae bacterium]
MKPTNPATEAPLQHYPEHSDEQLAARLQTAERAFPRWRGAGFGVRAEHLIRAAALLEDDRSELARLMTEEMGKPIVESEAEVDKCTSACRFSAENAERFLSPQRVQTEARASYVRFDPLGPVLAIMPWNFPLWQVFRFAAPALMAGNVALLKHAPNTWGTALAVENVFRRSGAPEGVFSTLLISDEKADELIGHPAVRAVTLTGSDRAGRLVGAQAGRHLRKVVLELGGSDPFIVLADADVDHVAAQAVRARTMNSGQSCIAAKRIIVEQPLADDFEERLVAGCEALRVGDPLDRETQIGPLARRDLLEKLHDQVERSLAAGARCLTGGKPLDRRGYYYPPTVLTGVRPGMPAFDEETFGPVAAVVRADDADEAVELANRSRFGLGASVWTADARRGESLAGKLEAGCVFINEIVKSDPRLPFGGMKQSGFGRELGTEGIREFTNVKTVWVG